MRNFFWTATVIGLLTACSQTDEIPAKDSMADNQQIRIHVGVNNLQTRAGYDNTNLDRFGLIINNTVDATCNYNVEMLKTGNAWEAADGTPLTWDEKRSPINVCAFAPYQKDVTMDGNLPIGVPVSYADANEVKAADFLLMKAQVNPQSDLTEDGSLRINLKHKLCKLTISFTGAGEITDLKVNGTVLSGSCNLSAENPVVTANGTDSSITPFKESDGTYQCILMPQTVESGKLNVTFTTSGRNFSWTSNQAITFEENHSYTLPLEVAGASLSLKKSVKARAWDVTAENEVLTIDK